MGDRCKNASPRRPNRANISESRATKGNGPGRPFGARAIWLKPYPDTNHTLLSGGGGSGGQVAQDSEEAGGGLLVGESFEIDRGGKMRRFGTETHAQQVVPARSHQGVDHRWEFLFPLRRTGEHDGPGDTIVQLRDLRTSLLSLCVSQRWRSTSRWMPGAQSRSASKVSVSLCLCQTLNNHWTGNGRGSKRMVTRVVKPVGGESHVSLQAGSALPAGLDHLAATGAGGFHPAQGSAPRRWL